MSTRGNTQMFALASPPPAELEVAGAPCTLAHVFKHDFFAATCLYERAGGDPPKTVVKFARTRPFCGLPMAWYGRLATGHEEALYHALAGVPGVPRWLGRPAPAAFAIEYVEATPLDHFQTPPRGFFDALRKLFGAIHARGVAICDANKRSNILVGDGGRPFLVDYQIAIRRRDDLPWPLRAIVASAVRYVQWCDLYHLCKHKSRLAPEEMTDEEWHRARSRGWLQTLHRRLTDPWRRVRRAFLRRQHRKGALESPTADLEDHHQPEKATWREERAP